MLIALAILAVVVVVVGVVVLWRATPDREPDATAAADEEGGERLIDVIPGGPGSLS